MVTEFITPVPTCYPDWFRQWVADARKAETYNDDIALLLFLGKSGDTGYSKILDAGLTLTPSLTLAALNRLHDSNLITPAGVFGVSELAYGLTTNGRSAFFFVNTPLLEIDVPAPYKPEPVPPYSVISQAITAWRKHKGLSEPPARAEDMLCRVLGDNARNAMIIDVQENRPIYRIDDLALVFVEGPTPADDCLMLHYMTLASPVSIRSPETLGKAIEWVITYVERTLYYSDEKPEADFNAEDFGDDDLDEDFDDFDDGDDE